MNKKQRDYFFPLIIERNGHELCIRCGKEGTDIHHVNGDDTDNRIDNLDLLCHSCNKLKRLQKKYLPVNSATYQISAAHKKALEAEPSFRRWLLGKMMVNNGHYPLDYVKREGAFVHKVSTVTIERYIDKLTDHPSSPYIIGPGQLGQEVYLKDKAPTDIDYL